MLSTAGNTPLVRIDKRSILAGRERRAETPSQARHFLDTMRGLFAWAIENSHVGRRLVTAPDQPACAWV
jgi:hypothetical protein